MSSFSIYPSLLFDVFLGFASSLLLASEGSDDIFDLTNPKTNNDGIATVEIEAKKKKSNIRYCKSNHRRRNTDR